MMFSLGVGAGVAACVHSHNTVALGVLLGLWLGIQVFMHLRARRARGVFMDQEIELFSWLGAAGFFCGLLFVSTYLVIFG